ncbi:MAG: hypothetical protein KKF52_04830 [Nanoarchaeota archaeon]|nr:hypothetical protein [Nanoarchaeota archaeon]MBU4242527.1 hypothetical protein [Nanoarchaeota archaeon]MBU4351649.1 hypothetical protein [Nanoarchaeota archaeon]
MVAENCWDYWDCKAKAKEGCIVFQSSIGNQCWLVKNTLNSQITPKGKNHFKSCAECPFFKEKNP